MPNMVPPGGSGVQGPYQWLTTADHDLTSLLQRYPQLVVGRYMAVTSIDSGALELTEQETKAGWKSRGQVAYSPQMQPAETLRYNECAEYDEWYVSQSALDLGRLSKENIFEHQMAPGTVFALVNFPHFRLHQGESNPLVKRSGNSSHGFSPSLISPTEPSF